MDIIDAVDLASYLREPEADYDVLDLLVGLANGIVSDALGNPEGDPSTKARSITLEVAARAYRNPDGYSSETVDDYTYRLPEDARRAGVYLTATEAAELGFIVSPRRVHIGWLV